MSISFTPRTHMLYLWLINFCAIAACTLSYIYLSYYVYTQTENTLYSQAVLFTPMILPALLVAPIYRLADYLAPRTLLWVANCLALGCALGTYLVLPYRPWVAIVGAVLIGALDALQRVGQIVAIKRYFSAPQIALSVPLTLTAQFVAGGLVGVSMVLFKERMSPGLALSITAGLFAIATLAAIVLPTLAASSAPPSRPMRLVPVLFELLRTAPALRGRLFQLILYVSLFQGFLNVSRVLLPAHVLGLGEAGVGLLQALNSVAALLGALAFYLLDKRRVSLSPVAIAGVSGLFMAIAAYAFDVRSSYLAHFFFIFFFELAFFRQQAELISHTPAQSISLIASVQYAGVYLGLLVTIFIGSLLVEWMGLFLTALLLAGAYYISAWLLRPGLTLRRKSPA